MTNKKPPLWLKEAREARNLIQNTPYGIWTRQCAAAKEMLDESQKVLAEIVDARLERGDVEALANSVLNVRNTTIHHLKELLHATDLVHADYLAVEGMFWIRETAKMEMEHLRNPEGDNDDPIEDF